MNYGIGYQGSKSKLVKYICPITLSTDFNKNAPILLVLANVLNTLKSEEYILFPIDTILCVYM
jgi:hypothetical protein